MIGPCLSKAIVEMLYDNGMVNRFHTEIEQVTKAAKTVTDNFTQFEIDQAEGFLSTLADDELVDFVVGAWDRCTLTDGETFADKILNEVFDNL